MKITFRLVAALAIVSACVAGLFSYWQARRQTEFQKYDLARRASVWAEGLQDPLEFLIQRQEKQKVSQLLERVAGNHRLVGLFLFDDRGRLIAGSGNARLDPGEVFSSVQKNPTSSAANHWFATLHGQPLHFYSVPLTLAEGNRGTLVFLQRADFMDARMENWRRVNFLWFAVLAFLMSGVTLGVVRWNLQRPINQVVNWLQQIRLGGAQEPPVVPIGDDLGPLTHEVTHLARSLTAARQAAEKEARLRLSAEAVWTPEKLKGYVRDRIGSRSLFLVSNREPYMHVRQGKRIQCVVPPSGLVTALEPVMRACGGVWIAQGSGDADPEISGAEGKLRVPPEEPAYTLKRIWVTPEEEKGHYYGFSNEGLWPLCHITHTRPIFRLEDWNQYQRVNQKFADALLEEIENEKEPLVLIQDYHFALLPLLVRDRRPDAHIALFWHIPWPNPESFSICPWKEDILKGMLGADLIGFHIQFHCNNFLETVDHVLEARINWEKFSVERGRHSTLVKPLPISVAPVERDPRRDAESPTAPAGKEQIAQESGIRAEFLGVGVDRLDYTKGILERFRAVERFLEKHPDSLGRFTFVELGAPSRETIPRYHEFIAEVEKAVESVNARFQSRDWRPLVLLKGHHSHPQILPFYRAADFCMVTSLHDGMNLVAKEFVAARSDEDGVLILSQFTGASRELTDALIVNPYDIEALADSIWRALEMDSGERRDRMRRMRAVVHDRNIYRWAANLISALCGLPSKPAVQPMT